MKLHLLILSVLTSISCSFGQGVNISFVSNLDYQALHNANLNDVWGYVDETGIEYALVGTTKGTSIVSLANPLNPVEVFWEPGGESIWRDLKVFGDVAYVTTEADDGLLIIDLSPLPQSNALSTSYYFGDVFGQYWTSAHNVFIDTTGGYAYICGANRGNGGMIILDLNPNPLSPIEVGTFDNWYCHDAFAQGNKLYGAHISDGFFSIIDITDHTNPVLINTQFTPNTFAHNIWATSDDSHVVTTDEVQGAFLAVYDISNPNSISESDRIQSTPGLSIIPHNAFILHDSLIVTSYYTDGITVHSMKRPNNLVEIGSYDTNPLGDGSFNGSWGVYPYLPSGLFLASDITEGLFVLQSSVSAASYFEGHVRDASTLAALNGVKVSIDNDPEVDFSNISGDFAVGTALTGNMNVTFFKVAYQSQTISVPFTNGNVVLDTINLIPIQPFAVTIKVQDALTGQAIPNANVRLEVPEMEQEMQTDGFGEALFGVYYPGNTFVTVGIWGHETKCFTTNIDQTTGTITISLDRGYFDDFSFDFGWATTTTGSSVTGEWERGIIFWPQGTTVPEFDVDYDCGDYAFVTGNSETFDVNLDDVDNGPVTLYSPIFDLTGYTDPYVNFHTWFFNFYGPTAPLDSLVIKLTNGMVTKRIVEQFSSGITTQWNANSIRVSDFLSPTSTMQLIIETSDIEPNGNITEAAFDLFSVSEMNILDADNIGLALNVELFPNPASTAITVTGANNQSYSIIDAKGQVCGSGLIQNNVPIQTEKLDAGLYILQVGLVKKRFIKG